MTHQSCPWWPGLVMSFSQARHWGTESPTTWAAVSSPLLSFLMLSVISVMKSQSHGGAHRKPGGGIDRSRVTRQDPHWLGLNVQHSKSASHRDPEVVVPPGKGIRSAADNTATSLKLVVEFPTIVAPIAVLEEGHGFAGSRKGRERLCARALSRMKEQRWSEASPNNNVGINPPTTQKIEAEIFDN